MPRARIAAVAIVGLVAIAPILLRLERERRNLPALGLDRLAPGVATPPTATPPPPWIGSVLAVAVPLDPGQAVALYDMGGEGAARELVSGFDEIGGLAWSPDGASLAFAGRREGNWDIFLIARDGTGLKRLTEHPAYDDWPAWSPDGRHIAFSSYRDDNLDLYRLSVGDAGSVDVGRLTMGDFPAIEPAWSPDGDWIVFSAWHDGVYRLEAVTITGDDRRVAVDNEGNADLRSPVWSRDGTRLAYLKRRYGPGQLTERLWSAEAHDAEDDDRSPAASTVAVQVNAFSRFPDSNAMATVANERNTRPVNIKDRTGFGRSRIALLPPGSGAVSWSRGPMPPGLAKLTVDASTPGSTFGATGPSADAEIFSGLVALPDVRVSGARIHAGLADDFAAMRAEVRAAVGADYLGTLSDLWRPLGYNGSSFFSWHKVGRALDTQMEFRGPGGRRDMVLVREEARGRTMWHMYLRAAAQDGRTGRPLVEPGWTFAAGSGDPELTAEGGKRGSRVPPGYWFDFTTVAERYGWQRIPSAARGGQDWRRNWTAIEYWHYERRDGLRWFDAARQVYSAEELDADLHADRLREQGISLRRLSWLGFPSGWFGGS